MKLRALVAGVAGSLVASAAFAADPIIIAPPPPPPMVVAPVGFDWSGPYAGANALVGFAGVGGYGVGGQFGINFVRGNLVFGVEGVAQYSPSGTAFIFGAVGKAGFALGPTDRVRVYGLGGILFSPGNVPPSIFIAGGGTALGLSDRLSLFAEVWAIPGVPACCYLYGGVNFHFGN